MWRSRLTLAAAVVLSMLAARTAHAGALGQVVHGLDHAAGNDGGGKSSGGSSSSDSSSDSSSSSSSSDHGSGGGSSCCSIEADSTLGVIFEPPGSAYDVRSELYVGAQSVENSDGAMTVEARALYRDFGLGVRGTSYVEQEDARENTYVRLDMWWLGGLYRLDQSEKWSVWAELGATGLHTSTNTSMNGLSAGLQFRHWLVGALSLNASGRYFAYQYDVQAVELFAAVQVSLLQFGYRFVDFNVGPPLRGPEVGLAFSF
jgi:hypothetical protein